MSTSDKNPPRPEQKRQAAESPLKKPEAETSRAQASDVERAANGKEAGLGSSSAPAGQHGPERDRARGAAGVPGAGDPVAAAHPRGIDVLNDEFSDSTIDADGKNAEARKDAPTIVSQATLVNAVPTPAEGLGGFDSRPGGELPMMALRDGYELVDHGAVPPAAQPGPIFMTGTVDDEAEARAAAARGVSYVAHRLRPERLIEIRPRRRTTH